MIGLVLVHIIISTLILIFILMILAIVSTLIIVIKIVALIFVTPLHHLRMLKQQCFEQAFKTSINVSKIATLFCSWAAFGRSWPLLGHSWAALGRSWAPLEGLLAALGALLTTFDDPSWRK